MIEEIDQANTGYDELDEALQDEVDSLLEVAMRQLGEDSVNAIVHQASQNAEGRSQNTYLLGIKHGIQDAINTQSTGSIVAGGQGQGTDSSGQGTGEPSEASGLFDPLSAEDQRTADRLALEELAKQKARDRNATQAPPAEDGLFALDNRQEDMGFVGGEPVSTSPSAAEMADLKAQMGQAFGELASLLGAKSNLTEEEETRLLPIMSKIFRIAAKMGYIQFKEAGRYVMQQIRELAGNEIADKLSLDNLQAG